VEGLREVRRVALFAQKVEAAENVAAYACLGQAFDIFLVVARMVFEVVRELGLAGDGAGKGHRVALG